MNANNDPHGARSALSGFRERLTHDEARRIVADGIAAWTSTQIDCVLARIALAQTQRRTEKATA